MIGALCKVLRLPLLQEFGRLRQKDSVCSARIGKWVYWWASNYASPGLLFCVAEGPAPRRLR